MAFSSSPVSGLLPSTSPPSLPSMPHFPHRKEERGLQPPVPYLSGTPISAGTYTGLASSGCGYTSAEPLPPPLLHTDPAGSGQPSPACAQKVGHQLHFSQCFSLIQLKSCSFPEAPKPHPALTAPSLMLCDRPMSGLPHLLPCHCYLLPWGTTPATRASGVGSSPPHAASSGLSLSGLPCYSPFCLCWANGRKAGCGGAEDMLSPLAEEGSGSWESDRHSQECSRF